MHITDSTISGNEQGITGSTNEGLSLKLTHSTVTGNVRGGIFAYHGEYGVAMTLNRPLIPGNGAMRFSSRSPSHIPIAQLPPTTSMPSVTAAMRA